MKRLFTTMIVLSIAFAGAFAQNDLNLAFEDNSDLANWSHHDETNWYTVEAWDATGGVDGSGGLKFTDAGYTFLVKRPVTATMGADYFVAIDIQTTSFAAVDFTLEVQGLSTDVPIVSVDTSSSFIHYTLHGIADLGTAGYIRLHSTGSGEAPEVRIDNVVWDDDVAEPQHLFFSEYIEGSSNNKALEIYNPGDVAVNLEGYQVAQSVNGGGWQYYHIFADGASIPAQDVYVLANSSAVTAITDVGNEILDYPSAVHHNGDDARAIIFATHNDTIWMDVIGDPNVDPGSGWDVAGVAAATANHTLVRKPEVMMGNLDWVMEAGADAATSEWIVYDEDTFTNIGSHEMNMGPMVTFEVNMAHQIMKANFDPANDYVDVAGDFNGWGPAAGEWQLEPRPDTNGIWIGTFPVPEGEYGFKFRINSSWDAGRHDGGDNRMLVVPPEGTHYFGYLDHYVEYPVIFFGVDLGDKFAKGEFDPMLDSVNVAGTFNGWGGDPGDLHPSPNDNLKWGAWIDQADLFTAGENIEFKFRINENWDNAESISNRVHTVTAGLQEYKAFWDDFDYNLSITFEVNMSAQVDAGEFNPASDYVDLAGNFNGWGGNDPDFWKLTDDDMDNVWSITVTDSFTVGQELEFKFRKNGNWDTAEFPGGNNRKYIVGNGAQVYHVWWNDFDPNFVGAPVTFKVNMSAQAAASLFDAANDDVFVTGLFGAIPMDDGDNDLIYETTASMPLGTTFYRFRINADGTESLPFDRSVEVTVPDVVVILDPVYFSNVAVVRHGAGNITFRVDMKVLESLGFYSRADGDSLELRGGVNGWGSDPDRSKIDMIRQPGTETYFLTVPFEGDAGDVFTYKFFLNLHQVAGGDSAKHAGEDFYEYELPASAGGGDRFFVWNGLDADTVLPVQTFQDYKFDGIIPTGETVNVTLYMDMSGAMMYEEDAFDPDTDELYFVWQDAWGAELQGVQAGDIPAGEEAMYKYERTWQSRSFGKYVYELTLPITGPAPHALMYTTRYIKSDGTEVDEMGSGYGFGRFRTQWLKPETVGGSIAPVQALEVVKFSNLGLPLEVFPEPYANNLTFANPVSTDTEILPERFALSQNYPNPFNPTTMIRYELPKAVNVDLVVYDLNGREITRLVDHSSQTAGQYEIMWNGLNAHGEKVASGLYFYRLVAGEFEQTHKMLMLK